MPCERWKGETRRGPRSRTWQAFVAFLAVGVCLVPPAFAGDAPSEAALSVREGRPITARAFAALIRTALLKDGNRNVKDATFFFQQCYGGAFVDQLKTAFEGTSLDWVAGSASSSTERSFGQNTPEAIDRSYGPGTPYLLTDEERALLSSRTPQNFWTRALVPEITKEQSVFAALEATNAADPAGATARVTESAMKKVSPRRSQIVETPQLAVGGQGKAITLEDAGAASHHAILWTGNSNRDRYRNDVSKVKAALIQLWGDPKDHANVTIDEAASLAELDAELKRLTGKLGPDEQFVFYASDHGEVVSPLPKPRAPLGPGRTDLGPVTLNEWQFTDMLTTVDNHPRLAMSVASPDGTPWSGSADVYLNGARIGALASGAGTQDIDVPKALLSLTNSLEIDVRSGGSLDITDLTFSIGQMPTVPDPSALPEPASLLLAGVAALTALASARRRHPNETGSRSCPSPTRRDARVTRSWRTSSGRRSTGRAACRAAASTPGP
ncbi:MAG: hypothetical protein U1F52_21330 [Burkholderiales bacterium]